MKKNIKLIILLLGIFILIIFFGIQSKEIEGINQDAINFITVYLDGFQRYLYVITFITSIIIAITSINYWNPIIKIRLKNNVFYHIWKKYLLAIIFYTIYILFCFFVVSIFYGYGNVIYAFNFKIILRLFMFILANFVIYNIIYLNTGKRFLGMALNILINFFILISALSYQFNMAINTVGEAQLMLVLDVYIVLVNIIGLIYLFINTDKKELIK